MLPNFIIFGAIKSGTGALYQYLSHHPQVFVSEIKEPRYFTYNEDELSDSRRSRRNVQITSLSQYEQLFSGAKNKIAIGEASSNYINSRYAAKKIKEIIPQVKLIATLRNPVDRAYAHYLMSNKSGVLDMRNIKSMRNEGWATTSLYYEKLKVYFDLFPRDHIKILIFEDWVNDVGSTLIDLYKYLGVDETISVSKRIRYAPAKVNWPGIHQASFLRRIRKRLPESMVVYLNRLKDRYMPARNERMLCAEVREVMGDWYREDVVKLQSLIGKNLDVWLR